MIVTLLTDFGTGDYYVAAMKGVILGHDPRISIVDITHEVPPQDIETAAYLLAACCHDFPAGTVHLVVVDPGVGASPPPLAGPIGNQSFVAPDNGVLSRVLDREAGHGLRVIDNRFRRPTRSSTFDGRDLFAPVAAALASGTEPEHIGSKLESPVRFTQLPLSPSIDGRAEGRLLHVDRFGNCVTSFSSEMFTGSSRFRGIVTGEHVIDRVVTHYAAGSAGEPFLVPGSAGYIEISINGGSAAEMLGLRRGDRIVAVEA